MKIGIVCSTNSWYGRRLSEEFQKRGEDVSVFPITKLVAGVGDGSKVRFEDQELESFDVLIIRSLPAGSLEQVIFRMDVLYRLQSLNVRILNNPRAIEKTVDKYYTSFILQDRGIPTPKTIVTERFKSAMEAFRELGGDVVVKPVFGSEGRGIVRLCEEDEAYRFFRAVELGRYVFYLQEYIPHDNWDIRTFVINGEVTAGMIRRGKTWKTNVSQGADVEPLELGIELEELSINAVEAIDAEYGSVDILKNPRGEYLVHEVNSIPGWKGLEKACNINVSERLAEFVSSLKFETADV